MNPLGMRRMENTQDIILDDLLGRWHQWAQAERHVRGYPSRSLVVGDFRISRQYDDANGALDSDLEATIMRAVDFTVTEMSDPWRAAIYVNARAIAVGLSVFQSPRLPADKLERLKVIADARSKLIVRLCNAGVI